MTAMMMTMMTMKKMLMKRKIEPDISLDITDTKSNKDVIFVGFKKPVDNEFDKFAGISDQAMMEALPVKYGGSPKVETYKYTWASAEGIRSFVDSLDKIEVETLRHVRNGGGLFHEGYWWDRQKYRPESNHAARRWKMAWYDSQSGITAYNLGKEVKAQTLYKFVAREPEKEHSYCQVKMTGT